MRMLSMVVMRAMTLQMRVIILSNIPVRHPCRLVLVHYHLQSVRSVLRLVQQVCPKLVTIMDKTWTNHLGKTHSLEFSLAGVRLRL